MESLTTEQRQQLVEIIIEESGQVLTLAEFTEILLGLLEEVSGFETAKQRAINSLINSLWSQYHE